MWEWRLIHLVHVAAIDAEEGRIASASAVPCITLQQSPMEY